MSENVQCKGPVLPIILSFRIMDEEILNLRRILSTNIKTQRAILGISQEKLAEKADISSNMINDIEGCRTWVSDKTLIRLANALETEIFRLLLPNSTSDADVSAVLALEIARELQTIKKNFDIQFECALKSKGLC
jgi:transcriptional regulator with XRE-family HTH domain